MDKQLRLIYLKLLNATLYWSIEDYINVNTFINKYAKERNLKWE